MADWKLFGVSLDIPVEDLDAIKLNDPHGRVENWKMEMFQLWLQSKPDASWKDVIQALELNNHGLLAARVKTIYKMGESAGKMLLHCCVS